MVSKADLKEHSKKTNPTRWKQLYTSEQKKTVTENYTRLPVKLNLSNKKLLAPVENGVDMQCKQQSNHFISK